MATNEKNSVITLDGCLLTIEKVVLVARGKDGVFPIVQICPTRRAELIRIRKKLEEVENSQIMYGINTGVGSNRNRIIAKEALLSYQRDYIMSHCVATGEPLPSEIVRAMILLRLNSFIRGNSGITVELADRLAFFLNANIIPLIPKHGSLGASGDLAQLAHLGSVLIGYYEAEAIYKGKKYNAKELHAELNIKPLRLKSKEAMALTNGATMTLGYAVLAINDLWQLWTLANLAVAFNLESIRGEMNAYDERIQNARNQVGQKLAAEQIRKLLQNSQRITKEAQSICFVHQDKSLCSNKCHEPRVQDAYSLRCVPQMHGAAFDAIKSAYEIINRELNASTDNPLIFEAKNGQLQVLSGGNFHGDPLAVQIDNLCIVSAKLANASNSRLFRLINSQFSFGLPQDLAGNAKSQTTGLMISQYSALSNCLRAAMLASPASVLTGVSSGMQEDIVSNSANGAWKLSKSVTALKDVLAIELLALAQALDLATQKLPIELAQMGDGSKICYDLLRKIVSFSNQDRYLAGDIRKVRKAIDNGRIFRKLIYYLDKK